MTARVGPRLSALLADLGIPQPGEPEPTARGLPPEDPNAADATTPVRVVVDTRSADHGAVQRAGLLLASWHGDGASGVVVPGQVPALAAVPGVLAIEMTSTARPGLHTSVPATKADHVRTGSMGLTGAGVVVGVVDTGIDIFHHAFRNPDGSTRLLALLDTTSPYTFTGQNGPTGGTFTIAWTPPASSGSTTAQTTAALPFNATVQQVLAALVGLAAIEPGDVLATGGPLPGSPVVVQFAGRYLHKDVDPLTVTNAAITPATALIVVQRGRTYTRNDIRDALAAPSSVFGSWDANGHGTHVMGIAAGDGSQADHCHGSDYYIGVAPGADLVAAKTTFEDADTVRGVQFVFDTATAAGPTVAAVANLSLGGQWGAHDGSAWDERQLDTMLTAGLAGRSIVVAAGNDGAPYDHTSPATQPASGGGQHARASVAASGTTTMDVVIAPSDRVDDWLNIWYIGAARFTFQLREPGGTSLPAPVAPGNPTFNGALAGCPVRVSNATNQTTTGRHQISIRISPPAGGAVVAGTWRITLTETAGQPADVDCWINLDKTDPHPRFSVADQDLTRTLTIPSTAHNVISVASYDPRDNELARSSGRGPTIDTRPAGEQKPDIAAPGVGITAAKTSVRGGICCDCCYDFYTTMSGTSMAAPHITGIVALLFQRNRTLTWDQVRAQLRASADPPDPITGPTLPNADWGAGIVNAEVAAAGVPAHAAAGDSPVVLPTFDDSPRVPAVVPAAEAQVLPGAPAAARLAELRAAVQATPAGQLAAALVSTHLDEALRLVNTRRRVTVAWHRMRGPDLLTAILSTPPGEPVAIPATIDGHSVRDGLARLLDELEEAGSLPLRTDAARYRDLLLTLPGLDLAELEQLDVAG